MNGKPQVDRKLGHVVYKFTFAVCLINATFNVSNIRDLSFTYTVDGKLRISQNRKWEDKNSSKQNLMADKKLRETSNLGVEMMNSKREVKRKLGHVIQIRVCPSKLIICSARTWASVILAGKRDSRRHCITSFSENFEVAETSHQMSEVLSFCDRKSLQ